jgi:predicted RNA methylase
VLNFIKRLRKPSVVDVLRVAADIRPSAIPFILFKALFRYPLYSIVLLLFVRNSRDLFELFLYRGRVKEIECRFGLGRFRLNINYAFLLSELILRRIYCYNVVGKVLAYFHSGYISMPSINYATELTVSFEKIYRSFDFIGRVLDVGGYCGETAFLFKKWGATEVVVYEPNHTLVQHTRETLLLNRIKGVVHELFVNASDSDITISWAKVLEDGFKVAKVDCEGCENYLLNLSDEQLRKVPNWVIECHSTHITKRLCEKFLRAGFMVLIKPYYWSVGYDRVGCETVFHSQSKIPENLLLIMIARL